MSMAAFRHLLPALAGAAPGLVCRARAHESAAGGMARGALCDEVGLYRYALWRVWDPAGSLVAFVLLNPSTADHERDDPTIRRCLGFGRAWGHGGLLVVNLFAYRATDPRALVRAADPVGPAGDVVLDLVSPAALIVAGWGVHGLRGDRARCVCSALAARGLPLHHLGLTQDGAPRHPLYLPTRTCPIAWHRATA